MPEPEKFSATGLIARKRDGHTLTEKEIHAFIAAVTSGRMTDAQVGAMLMAIFLQGLSDSELKALTEAMVRSGDRLDLEGVGPPRIDKHSTGGVGDKVSLVFAPLMAAVGIRVPMLSGRALDHTGGTLDKLESIPGLTTDLSPRQFRDILQRTGMAIAGADPRLVPADRRLYALRDATATVGLMGLCASSIMSKKLAVGADGLVLDVKTGSGAFMHSHEEALTLCRTMVEMGSAAGRPVIGLITRMDQPLGNRVGNALEVAEALDALNGRGPADLMAVTLALGEAAMDLAGRTGGPDSHRDQMQKAIESGKAMDVMRRWIEAQGGDSRVCDDPARLPGATEALVFRAGKAGFLFKLDAREIGMAANAAGAGRSHPDDRPDPGAGLVLHRKCGDGVQPEDPLVSVYCNDPDRVAAVREHLARAVEITPAPPRTKEDKVVLYRVDARGIQVI